MFSIIDCLRGLMVRVLASQSGDPREETHDGFESRVAQQLSVLFLVWQGHYRLIT